MTEVALTSRTMLPVGDTDLPGKSLHLFLCVVCGPPVLVGLLYTTAGGTAATSISDTVNICLSRQLTDPISYRPAGRHLVNRDIPSRVNRERSNSNVYYYYIYITVYIIKKKKLPGVTTARLCIDFGHVQQKCCARFTAF